MICCILISVYNLIDYWNEFAHNLFFIRYIQTLFAKLTWIWPIKLPTVDHTTVEFWFKFPNWTYFFCRRIVPRQPNIYLSGSMDRRLSGWDVSFWDHTPADSIDSDVVAIMSFGYSDRVETPTKMQNAVELRH